MLGIPSLLRTRRMLETTPAADGLGGAIEVRTTLSLSYRFAYS